MNTINSYFLLPVHHFFSWVGASLLLRIRTLFARLVPHAHQEQSPPPPPLQGRVVEKDTSISIPPAPLFIPSEQKDSPELSALKQELIQKRQEVDAFLNSSPSPAETFTALRKTLADKTQELRQKQERHHSLSLDIEKIDPALQKSTEELTQLKTQIADLKKKQKAESEAFDPVNRLCLEAQKKLSEENDRCVFFRDQTRISELEGQLQAFTTKANAAHDNYNALTEKLIPLKHQQKRLVATQQEVIAKKEQLSTTCTDLSTRISQLEKEIQEDKSERQRQEVKFSQLEKECIDLKANWLEKSSKNYSAPEYRNLESTALKLSAALHTPSQFLS